SGDRRGQKVCLHPDHGDSRTDGLPRSDGLLHVHGRHSRPVDDSQNGFLRRLRHLCDGGDMDRCLGCPDPQVGASRRIERPMNPSPFLIAARATGFGVLVVVAAIVWNTWGRTQLGGPFVPWEIVAIVALGVVALVMLAVGWAYKLRR